MASLPLARRQFDNATRRVVLPVEPILLMPFWPSFLCNVLSVALSSVFDDSSVSGPHTETGGVCILPPLWGPTFKVVFSLKPIVLLLRRYDAFSYEVAFPVMGTHL